MRLGFRTALAILAITAFANCRQAATPSSSESKLSELPTISGEVVTVELQPWPTIVRVQGSLVADEVTSVAARVAGRVVSVHFDLGDEVAENDVLVSLDSTEFELKQAQAEAQLAQARAAIGLKPDDELENLNPANAPPVREARAVLEEARQQVQRLEKLFSQGAIVAIDLETAQSLATVAEARLNSAMNSVREKIAMVRVQSAQLELARQEFADTSIRAPFHGLVQKRAVAQGTYVQIGQPLMEIAKTDRLRYRASVPERFAQSLTEGQSVEIHLGNQKRMARIERISPALDPISRSLTFEAIVENADNSLKAGLFAPADVVIDEQTQSVVVQPSSITRFAGVDKVWRVSEGQVLEAVVRLGRQTEYGVEVLEGLLPGDQILVNAQEGKRGSYRNSPVEATNVAAESSADAKESSGSPGTSRSVSTSPAIDSSPSTQSVNGISDPKT